MEPPLQDAVSVPLFMKLARPLFIVSLTNKNIL